MQNELYDVIIIGAGPAGMSASLYASRANLKVLMIERECPGGKMLKTRKIENYLGAYSCDAIELASVMFKQSIQYGAKYKQSTVVNVKSEENVKFVELSNGEYLTAKTLILAIGGQISNKGFKYDKYLNKGLSYCVVCDANFYKDKIVAIIGQNKNIDDVIYLSNIAKQVHFVNLSDAVCNRENVQTYTNVENYRICGSDRVEYIEVNGIAINVDGVFYVENSNCFSGFDETLATDNGYIIVDKDMHTSIEGVYACGDVINKNIKQVISACGDGALAALEAIKYVNKSK